MHFQTGHMPTRLRRRAWLAGIALLHLAAFLSWRHPSFPGQTSARIESELIFLQPPKPRSQPLPPLAAAAPAAVATKRAAPPPPAALSATAPAASASAPAVPEAITVPATEADPFALPAPVAPSSRERARMAAAGVDRQLRKESLNKFATIVESDTKLGKAIARAQNKEWVLEQTADLGDGVTMKRYRKGNLEVCEYVNLVGARGQDPFRDGNKTMTKTCP
jgi:hypothetical protein